MRNNIKETNKEIVKAGIPLKAGLISTIIIVCLVVAVTFPKPIVLQDEEGSWSIIWQIDSASAAENDPGAGLADGWLSFFCLDYAETPATCLAANNSGGDYGSWGNVSGYQNTDDAAAMDLPSDDPFYFVARACFNKTHAYGSSQFWDDRCSIRLTVSGDETIADVEGTRVVSYNDSSEEWIWINFYWDHGAACQIEDDGSLAWNITISAKF